MSKKVIGSGRKKGTPNKQIKNLREQLERANFFIAEEAVKLYKDSLVETTKLKILELLCTYTLSRPKEIDPNELEDDEPVDVTPVTNSNIIDIIKK